VLWRNNQWENVISFDALALYPQLQLDANGRVLMSGPQFFSKFLDLQQNDINPNQTGKTIGGWRDDPPNLNRKAGFRDYAPCVMYEPG
jgi:hypothetical protein